MNNYQTKPMQVEAHVIDAVQVVEMPDGHVVVFHTEMGDKMANIGLSTAGAPVVGDYFVSHPSGDGFVKKSEFEANYEPIMASAIIAAEGPAPEPAPIVEAV